jgi:DedD protein
VELLVKERLTGAIILVILIVLLVPELLSGPKGPAAAAPAGAASPSSEEPPLRSYTINLGDDSHSQTEPAGSAAGSAAASNGPGMPQPSGPEQPTAQPGAPQSSTSEPAGSLSQSGAGQSSGTPLETPQQPASHDQSATRAAKSTAPPQKPAATPKPSSQASSSSAAARTEASKPARTAAAEKAGKGRSAAANTASNSEPSGWGVQLGVFASRENAERLALEVRVKGFKASVSPVSSGGRKLYRVRVGPAPDRSGAQELQGRLKAAGRPGGTIVPYS